MFLAFSCTIELADEASLDSESYAQDINVTRDLSASGLTPEEAQIEWYRAATERLRVLEVEVRDAQGRAFKAWAEGQKELADARIRHMAANIKELAARQVALDARLIEGMQRYQMALLQRLTKNQRTAAGLRRDGKLSQERITALKAFFTEGAIGISRDTMLGEALRELRASKPEKYQEIINEEGELLGLDAEHFIPRTRNGIRETYIVQLPDVAPPDDGLWELHLRTRWQNEYHVSVEVRLTDDDRIPGDQMLARQSLSRIRARDITEKRGPYWREYEVVVGTRPGIEVNVIPFNTDLKPGSFLWVRIRGGGSGGTNGTQVPLRPDFYFVAADMTGRGGPTRITTEKPATRHRLQDLPPTALTFEGGDIVDLLRFCVTNELDLRGDAHDIVDHAFSHVERHVRTAAVNGLKEMTELRDDLLKFEKDVLNARAAILNGPAPGFLGAPQAPMN